MKKIVFHLSFPCYPTSNRTALWLTARMSVPIACTCVRRQFRRLSRKTADREAARLLRRLRPRTYEMSQMQRVTQRHHCTQYSRPAEPAAGGRGHTAARLLLYRPGSGSGSCRSAPASQRPTPETVSHLPDTAAAAAPRPHYVRRPPPSHHNTRHAADTG